MESLDQQQPAEGEGNRKGEAALAKPDSNDSEKQSHSDNGKVGSGDTADANGEDGDPEPPPAVVEEPSFLLDDTATNDTSKPPPTTTLEDDLPNENQPPPLDIISASLSNHGINHDNHNDDHNGIGNMNARKPSSVQTHLEDQDLPIMMTTTPSLINESGGRDEDDERMDDSRMAHDDNDNDANGSSSMPPPRFVPGPLREEQTLKEKLVDRERQRRKEAERARLKRQFALTSSNNDGGGMAFDNNVVAGSGAALSTTGAVLRENGSIAGTVGEESIRSIPYLEDSQSNHNHHNHRNPGGDQTPQQLGYTMERFLLERDANAKDNPIRITTSITEVAALAAGMDKKSTSNSDHSESNINNNNHGKKHDNNNAENSNNINVIREEIIEGESNTALVMERFLNDPVVVDAPGPPSTSGALHGGGDLQSRPDDVHRSVSFDMELRTTQYNDTDDNGDNNIIMSNSNTPRNPLVDAHFNRSIDDSNNVSVQVEMATDDENMTEPVSSGLHLSVPSEVAPPSSLGIDDDHPLGSVGDRQSVSMSNASHDNDDSTAGEPRVFRLTEAEIQEMAAIEEASIGNAPPSDRDAESLVGDLVGEFGTRDPAGTTFSQGTPTTAMESDSILSGNPSAMPHDQDGGEQQVHGGENLNLNLDSEVNHRSIDAMMAMVPSVSSHLGVSLGGSASGSAVSVAVNPPSEIIERGRPSAALLLDDDEEGDNHHHISDPTRQLPPPPVVVGSLAGSRRSTHSDDDDDNDRGTNGNTGMAEPTINLNNIPLVVARTSPPPRPDCENSAAIRAELDTLGPPSEAIVNRRMRPGMVNAAQRPNLDSPESSPVRRIVSLPAKINNGSSIEDTPKNNRTLDDFDFDKDLPMTPHSIFSDSIRDLPGEDGWTSPDIKMSVSPFRQTKIGQKDPTLDPKLRLPNMSQGQTPSIQRASSDGTDLSKLDCVFRDLQMSSDSTVQGKESEIYCRGSILTKVLQTRLLPLMLTCGIELLALRMITGGSDRLCHLLGRQQQQLLIGFLPVIAALSGEVSTQASALTARAVSHGHLSSRNVKSWFVEESKVAGLVGLGMGATLAMIASSVTSGNSLVFALTVGIVQCISASCAGCVGSVSPLLLSFLLKKYSKHVSGLIERSVPDVIAASLTTGLSYALLSLVVSPSVDPADAFSSV